MTLHRKDALRSDRQTVILEQVAETGYVTIEALAARFGVSTQTVRRDIIALAESGRLQRFHGGAGPVGATEAARLDHGAKREIGRPEKAIVGRRAAAMVPDGAAVFLDVGTTIEACARELARRQGFVVFTNSMRAAMEFDPALHEVHVLGGRMAGRDGSLVGEGVVEMLRNVRLDVALIACSAVEEGGQVMDFDLSKIAVKRAAMAASNRSLLLATRSKFGRRALGTIGPVDRFDALVTED
ncbi:DeoR/GlpR family DNA-binding transcription regulator [Salipiger marinus]|jgi:DeoR family transcriptional regulator, glycerol-3-phosphate regulon repressor|uniref:Transcriptional regulator, DeoR family n=1 Tax=Salipiger marinus TaxID=555512 RepID=A0A1G8JRZ0_9RHOB|nr:MULTISPECIES: DeoR/GlpR family DNA-binding transcription regulator [Salipiger]MCD1619553.1 DeoR/GlpR family DNA-binding transcription regulator [Salipiger manganoxidans]MEB3419484.1 DeoR/GlpR family DNA-binding transcription regulator [Salipiger manganoxidans]SDI33797.1 transcriptional regulator, DeoR family [Salipiger marinus]HBM60580.1 DeoR/GlpR transcriptional regulator [Citreicella sp.]